MGLSDLSDEELVRELKSTSGSARDQLANQLFSRHYDRVARWCLRFTNDRELAADLAQDVFLKAHRRLDSFKGDARFSTWLYSIVRNEAITRLQRKPPPMDADEMLDDLVALDDSPQEIVERSRLADRVKTFLLD